MHKVMHWVHRLSGSTMSVASVTYELKKMYMTLPHLVYTAPPACGPGPLAPLTTTVQSPFTAGAKTDTKSKQAARVVNIAFCRINRSVSVRMHCTGGVSVTGGLIYILHNLIYVYNLYTYCIFFMSFGLQTVFSLERCPLITVSFMVLREY